MMVFADQPGPDDADADPDLNAAPCGAHEHYAGRAHRQNQSRREGQPEPRLTPSRRLVLDVLNRSVIPLGAYDVIDRIQAETGKRLAPISVYRALDFLLEHGWAHRLASRNAFLACGHGHAAADLVVFLICDGCGRVQEMTSDSVLRSLSDIAKEIGFAPRSRIVEVAGQCAACGAERAERAG
jgi:Fur family zinc uptake transcriptional regulator